MTVESNVFGQLYDDVEPSFQLMQGGMYFNRVDKKVYSKVSLDALAATKGGYGANEIGTFSAAYKANHNGAAKATQGTVVPPPATGNPITATVTKVPLAAPNNTGQITVAGGPADKAYTATITVKDAASAGDDINAVPIPKGSTAAVSAGLIRAAIKDANVSSAVVGAVITVTPKVGSTLAKLTISVK